MNFALVLTHNPESVPDRGATAAGRYRNGRGRYRSGVGVIRGVRFPDCEIVRGTLLGQINDGIVGCSRSNCLCLDV